MARPEVSSLFYCIVMAILGPLSGVRARLEFFHITIRIFFNNEISCFFIQVLVMGGSLQNPHVLGVDKGALQQSLMTA
jgi:hypothetical protein